MTGKVKSVLLIAFAILLGIVAALILYFYHIFYYSEIFLPGVHIGNVSVAGLSPKEAEAKLDEYMQKALNQDIVFIYENYSYSCKLSDLANQLASTEIVRDVWEKEKNRSIKSKILNLDGKAKIDYPIHIAYNSEVWEKIVKEWEQNLNIPYSDAKLEFKAEKGLIIVPAKEGGAVDDLATKDKLPQKIEEIKDEAYNIPIVVKKVLPRVTAEEFKNIGLLASYTTWYDTALVDRSHNLAIAARAINGKIVMPEEVFSFNGVVGERSFAAGYRDALVIIGGKFAPGVGGGICQVSSTLYNAVLLAGLPIVERHNHTLAVAYVPLGFDATVAYGLQDFKFKNNTPNPLYIKSEVGNGKLTVYIYGNLDYRRNVKTSHVIDKVTDFTEIREFKPDLKPGEEKIETKGNPGYVVRSFRSFYDSSGNLIRTEMLSRDNYAPLNRLIYVGPKHNSNSSANNKEVPGNEVPDTGNSQNPGIKDDDDAAIENQL